MEVISNNEISVVVQGPVDPSITPLTLRSVRRILPGAIIILSTWKGADVTGLDYDILLENEDPGGNLIGGQPSNCFRQIVSSRNGLKAVKTTYALRIRSDMTLTSRKFLRYFADYATLPFDENYRAVHERVAMFTTHNPRRDGTQLFWPSDWFYFGMTQDLLDIFDIPLKDDDQPYVPEQFIWVNFLSKHHAIPPTAATDFTPANIELSERYYANNAILLSARRAGARSLKHSANAGYTQIPALSHGFYTFADYKYLLNRYSGAHLTVIPNPLEETVYAFRMFIKKTLKDRLPGIYRAVRKMINS